MPVPPAVTAVVGDGAEWSADHEGQSGGVWKTTGAAGTFFVKHGEDAAREHDRLRWLTGRVPVPEIAAFTGDWLVLADARAVSVATEPPADPGAAMGAILRRLHLLPVARCPFDARTPVTVGQARHNVAAGLVDADDFDDDHAGSTPGELLDRLVALCPADEDLVVSHGDFTAENVLLRPDGSALLTDVSRLGVADRHRDIALACRGLTGDQAGSFLAAYGLIDRPDPARLYWYRLLDEFL
ncbi:aminoglycoside 3'-phosphotransferase [Amycolatopsis suaedae]|uniref:Aminoglycoside 3'-phosphotransferase n=1 Tax=Amycolatopsis suaedae TaxID=2510978 RepID=A0A4Q7JFT4_9PSEU|nr:aminoglycoside 3'-phosphotransferase [Amycolatopsis suaedae]RZQ65783.1 aminoglycoside 3'-phosphotransferase [Amycolatopsis suaedae]